MQFTTFLTAVVAFCAFLPTGMSAAQSGNSCLSYPNCLAGCQSVANYSSAECHGICDCATPPNVKECLLNVRPCVKGCLSYKLRDSAKCNGQCLVFASAVMLIEFPLRIMSCYVC
ncbi:hypothetical protein GALMADRAFT_1246188 [Galerina marginata CBS 339.88]|uniref:Extracellular membrane protein CFEM domain-containing protein n=1 Tax=Galerina marginata (strain CBS 339.88) TaxID=685588 RepID=A0A067TB98_GALM3|nr:hypothetical protein GALMADRAFT_1246188 [Galerina marginata CBS 339.88]